MQMQTYNSYFQRTGDGAREILLRCQAKEEDEIFEPDIRREHLTLGDSSDED